MAPQQTELLRDNCVEIAHAARNSQTNALPLIANWGGRRIYDARYGWGRLWMLFYQLSHLILPRDFALHKLTQALHYTHSIFQTHLPEIEKHIQVYKKSLLRASKGYDVPDNESSASKIMLLKWKTFIIPCLKAMQESADARLSSLFHSCFNLYQPFNDDVSLIESNESTWVKDLALCQKIIKLESVLKSRMPWALFRKILKEKPLNSSENTLLCKWIKKINKSNISISSLHRALTAFAFLNCKPKEHLLLEMYLEKSGCTVFQRPDTKWLSWQQQLRKGAQVSEGNFHFKLSSEIPPRHSQKDHFRIFGIEEDPERVIVVAHNPVALKLKNLALSFSQIDSFIETAAFTFVSKDGRFALMERLYPLDSYHWKSAEDPFLQKIAKLLSEFVVENYTPAPFDDFTLLFDKKQHLKTLKPMVKSRFDFDAIEQFILHLSHGNLPIFQKLMHLSKLSTHPIAQFYGEAVNHFFDRDSLALDDLAGIYKISQATVVDRARHLTTSLQEMIEQLSVNFIHNYPDYDASRIRTIVKELVLTKYRSTQAAGVVLFTHFDIAHQKIIDKLRLST